jgi:tetratricopeptide (TPR) repeat protein
MDLSHQSEMAPLARTQALKALALDSTLADAHGSLCAIAATYDRDWPEAQRQFLLATAAGHSSPLSHFVCAFAYLLSSGQIQAAILQMQLAVQADPLHITYRSILGVCLDAAGRHDEAEEILLQTREFAPEALMPTFYLARIYLVSSRFAEALALAEKCFALAPWFPPGLSLYAGLLTRTGQVVKGQTLLGKLRLDSPGGNANRAKYSLCCEELDQAAHWFEQALANRDACAMNYLHMALAKPLRESMHWPRLAALMNLKETIHA